MPKLLELENQKFGRLIVQKFAGYKGKRRCWKCICSCGKETILSTNKLTSGQTKSCGCLKQDYVASLRLPKREASFNYYYNQYRQNAKYAGRKFELTKEQFRELTSSNCFYCGCVPTQVIAHKVKQHRSNGLFVHNGIDRIDNSKGYVFDNCVPCCKVCNKMKGSLNREKFLKQIEKIKNYQEGNK